MAGYQYQIPNGINSANGFAKRKYPFCFFDKRGCFPWHGR